MTSFQTLKKSTNTLERLARELEKLNAPQSQEKASGDSRFWKPEVDKAGNGAAIIRFLPPPAKDGDDALPWVRLWTHGFQGPTGKYYIENSLTTLNQKDPVSELNGKLWNSSQDDKSPERKQARDQKRKLTYISNILVISDPKAPHNEGKVFLFKYGKKIFDKITLLMNPEFEGDSPINPFDLWKGCNFKLRIRNVDGYRNYDQSSFDSPTTLPGTDADLEKIYNSEHSLAQFVAPDQFKSYDELKKKLNEVLGLEELIVSTPKPALVKKEDPFAAASRRQSVPDTSADDEDEDLKAFKALADD